MSFIVRWLLGKMNSLFADCLILAQNMSLSAFSNSAVTGILSAMKSIGLPLLGVSILVLLAKKIIALMDGQDVAFGDTIQRIIIGTVTFQYGVQIMKWLHLMLLDIGKEVVQAITSTQEFDIDLLTEMAFDSSLFVLILVIIAIFYMIKTILSLLERFWLLLITLCMLYFYLAGYIAGNDEALILWFKQCLGFGLTQVFQTTILVLGMSLFVATGQMTDFALAIGCVIGSSKADQVLDKFGQPSGGKMGNVARNAMSSVYYARMLFTK